MIPEEKKAVVIRALQEAFGVTEFEDIRGITRGLSSDLLFRLVVQESPYLLRIMARIDERMDPNRIFACRHRLQEPFLSSSCNYDFRT
jgi:hypothetical protein